MPENITLRTPITFEGETVSALTLDLEGLTGADLINAEQAVITASPMPRTSVNAMYQDYQAVVGAKAAGKPVELIHALKARDFNEVCVRVQGFLLGMDSESDPGEPSES